MTFFYIITALLILILYMCLEASWVQTVKTDHSENDQGFKIIQLSDIHINNLSVSARRVKKVINRENPDLIVFTGDYIEKPNNVKSYIRFHSIVTEGRQSIACIGNHDIKAFRKDFNGYNEFVRQLNACGTAVLDDSTVTFVKNSRKYSFTGFKDLRQGQPHIEKALASICKDACVKAGISHNPDISLRLPKSSLDYLFCGHFHGGQFWAPFDLEFKVLRSDKLCKQGVKRGLHKINGINLYVNRGLGGVFFPMRFLSRPEITVFTLP